MDNSAQRIQTHSDHARYDEQKTYKLDKDFGCDSSADARRKRPRRRYRKKVTAVTKANIMKCTDKLFYETARKVAKDYDDKIEYEERLIDNMCMQLVQKPELYDPET